MRSICFYNHYHNGDIFCSKAFVQQIMDYIPTTYYYSHRMNPNILKDMDLAYTPLIDSLPQKGNITINENVVFINTWIGSYFDIGIKYPNECTLRFLYEAYGRVYHAVSQIFGVTIDLQPIEYYFPLCNYDRLNTLSVDDWISKNESKKVLISNGPCHSGQCDYNGDMAEIINILAEKRKDVNFIVTQKIPTSHTNIVYTSDITQVSGFDLNEISYLSTHCDLIIGRNSGPLCFCSTKENLNDPKKTFYSFGTRETDCLTYGINTKSKQIFEKYSDLASLQKSLTTLVENLE